MKSDKYSKTSVSAPHFLRAADETRRLFAKLEGAPNDCNGCPERLLQRRTAAFLARLRRAMLPVALLLVSAWAAAAKAPAIMASLEPTEIAFGDVAQLTVTLQGQDQNAPQLPAVSGLSFQHLGQSSQIQVINGA